MIRAALVLVAFVTLACSCRHTWTPTSSPVASSSSAALSASQAPSSPRLLYGRAIVPPPTPSPQLNAAVEDAVQALWQATGERFSGAPGSPPQGIFLVRSTDKNAPADQVKRLLLAGPEAFVIRSVDNERLWIFANSEVGLAHGLYYYLGRLGCRWLLPSEAWTVIPERRDIQLGIDALIAPAFRSRTFFGTGDFGPPTPVDPKGVMRHRWDLWRLRNGFGGEFVLSGHAGQAFAVANRAALETHPEYLAMVGGKRTAWSPAAALCVSNPGLVKIWVADRLAALRHTIQTDPTAPWSVAVSVEPADAASHCECARCKAIGAGTESDQVFYLANQVARAVAKEFPGHFVNLMAYAQHAAPPAIPLEKNVYVTVVPEAFQRTGLSSDKLIAAWRTRVDHLAVYTYWSTPDWAFDMPTFDFLTIPAQRLRSWRAAKIEGVSLETTYGGGAMGPGLYFASRLLWNPDEDARALSEDFFRSAFGPAAAAMRRMVERWATDFTPTGYELGLAYPDLAEAKLNAAHDPARLRRIRDYEAYVHYVRLWLEYQGQPAHSEERRTRARALLAWLNRIYDTGMVASYRLRELLLNRLERDPALSSEFGVQSPGGSGWAQSSGSTTLEELDRLMVEGARVYPPPPHLESKTYSAKLVPQKHPPPPSPSDGKELSLAGGIDVAIEVVPGRHLEFEISVRKNAYVAADVITVTGPAGAVVLEKRIPADWSMNPISLPDSPPGLYRCHVEDQKATFVIHVPPGVPMAINELVSTDLSPRMYFWVPPGLRRIGMYAPSAYPLELLDADGRAVPTSGAGVILADVPPGQDGRAWSLRKYKSWTALRPMNFPWAFAPSPDVLLVPEDAQR